MSRAIVVAAVLVVGAACAGRSRPTPAAADTSLTIEAVMARADSAERARDPASAARAFEHAYRLTGFDPAMLAAAAASAAQAGGDSMALAHLRRAIDEGYLRLDYLAYLERDTAFVAIRRDARWQSLIAAARARHASLDTALRAELLQLAEQDQRNRSGIQAFVMQHGRNSPQVDSAIAVLAAADAPILARLESIVARVGWPKRSLVGDDGAHAAWLLVQHAPSDYQREVLPLVMAAAKAGEARASDAAYLEDRVRVADGKPQRYGTQLRDAERPGPPVLSRIEDEACVDRRRASVGLEPLRHYLRRHGVEYRGPPGRCTA